MLANLWLAPGCSGSMDRLSRIPAKCQQISAVAAITEAEFPELSAQLHEESYVLHLRRTSEMDSTANGSGSGNRVRRDFLRTQNAVNRAMVLRKIDLLTLMKPEAVGGAGRCVAYVVQRANSGAG